MKNRGDPNMTTFDPQFLLQNPVLLLKYEGEKRAQKLHYQPCYVNFQYEKNIVLY